MSTCLCGSSGASLSVLPALLSAAAVSLSLQAGRKRILNLKDFYARGLTEGEGGFKATDEFTATNAALCLLPAHSGSEIPLSYDSPPHPPTSLPLPKPI